MGGPIISERVNAERQAIAAVDPRRWAAPLAGLIALALFVVLYLAWRPVYGEALRQLGIHAFIYPFLDPKTRS